MECPICMEVYCTDGGNLVPKVMPCGHTACVSCLRKVKTCPKCRREFGDSVDALPTNYVVLDGEGRQERGDDLPVWWCTECREPSSAHCRRRHLVLHGQEALRRAVAAFAPRAVDAVRGLDEAVCGLPREPARSALQLLATPTPPATCELSVRQADPGSDGGSVLFRAQWTLWSPGEVGGVADGLDRALVCMLAASGRMHKVDEPPMSPEAAAQAAKDAATEAAAKCLVEVEDVGFLSCSPPGLRVRRKEDTLSAAPKKKVQRLDYLSCSYDPKWSLSLLEAAVDTLEELCLSSPGAEHLHKAHAAPRLRRLEVRFAYSLDAGPPVLPALAAPSCLQWLRADHLPRTTLDSLLRAHAATLRTLWLTVGFPGMDDQGWPWPAKLANLDALLKSCGLAGLQRLVLDRPHDPSSNSLRPYCNEHYCRAQRKALRSVLPGAAIQCSVCDKVAEEKF